MKRGGQNRSHGSTGDLSRIDSFYWINRQYARDYAAETGDPEAALPIEPDVPVRVVWTANTFDKTGQPSRMYWLCPRCSRRARFLYHTGLTYLCRRCARLNYPCQQQSRNAETEEQNMRSALIEMGCNELARAPLGKLMDATPPPFPEGWDVRSFVHGWRRFCKARERCGKHLYSRLMRLSRPHIVRNYDESQEPWHEERSNPT